MYFLERLTSASCRSLAAMIGCASGRGRRGRSGQSGSPDDRARCASFNTGAETAPGIWSSAYSDGVRASMTVSKFLKSIEA